MDDDDWLVWALGRVGALVPCAICGTATAAADLTEATVPGALISEWDVVVARLIWVCPACPAP